MTATNHAEHYGLSQYTEDDRPTYTGDYNGDMAKIDAAIYAASQSGGIATVAHTDDLTGDGSTSALTSGLAGKVDKTASQPGTLGLTATELDSMYKDANGIVRVGTAE